MGRVMGYAGIEMAILAPLGRAGPCASKVARRASDGSVRPVSKSTQRGKIAAMEKPTSACSGRRAAFLRRRR
jgi:hypothetical protein